jgi:hypothetical protein
MAVVLFSCLVLILIKVLSLNNNHIAALGPVLGRCTALQVLQLSGNRLTELGLQPLAALRKLRDLDAANNCLQSVEAELFNLLPLQDLDLSANMLSALPSSIGSMPALTQLKARSLYVFYFFVIFALGCLQRPYAAATLSLESRSLDFASRQSRGSRAHQEVLHALDSALSARRRRAQQQRRGRDALVG